MYNVVLIPVIFKKSHNVFSEKILEGSKQFHYTFVKKKKISVAGPVHPVTLF